MSDKLPSYTKVPKSVGIGKGAETFPENFQPAPERNFAGKGDSTLQVEDAKQSGRNKPA